MERPREKIGKDRNKNSFAPSSQRKRNDDRVTAGRNSDPIPLDLTIEILTRLPVKSLVRFQCVSKLWSSLIRCRDFIDSFLIQSSTRPRLLVSFCDYFETEHYIFSWPHPENPAEESSSVANLDMAIPGMESYYMASNSLRGLICYEHWNDVRICNPSTRQVVTLPKAKPEIPEYHYGLWYSFGYDTINNRFKVLCIAFKGDDDQKLISEHQIFVLGAGNSWRTIECNAPHRPVTRGLWIDGVLYYAARTEGVNLVDNCIMVNFDVCFEKFSYTKLPDGARRVLIKGSSALINCQGKLAVVDYSCLMTNFCLDLWVLEDANKEEWSKRSCALPPPWRDFECPLSWDFRDFYFSVRNTVHTGAILLQPRSVSDPLYVFYYDFKKNVIRKIRIEGITDHEFRHRNRFFRDHCHCMCFSDHVDSIMFLEDCLLLDD